MAKPQQRSTPALNTRQRGKFVRRRVGRRQADSENGSIGHLEPGRGPDEAPMGGETRQSPRNSIPTGTGCACRGEAGAPFEPKAV